MEVYSYDGSEMHSIKFAKGEPVSELETHPLEKRGKKRGTIIRWRPDLDVFTDIAIPRDFFEGTLQRQSVVNKGLKFVLHYEKEDGGFDTEEFVYENGIADYIREIANGTALTEPVLWTLECSRPRPRGQGRLQAACRGRLLFLEYGQPHRVLPQFQLSRARRLARQGGAHRVCLRGGQVSEGGWRL